MLSPRSRTRREFPGPAAIDLRRQATWGWSHTFGLQHPKGKIYNIRGGLEIKELFDAGWTKLRNANMRDAVADSTFRNQLSPCPPSPRWYHWAVSQGPRSSSIAIRWSAESATYDLKYQMPKSQLTFHKQARLPPVPPTAERRNAVTPTNSDQRRS